MDQTRFRTGIALMVLGGGVYVAAALDTSNTLYAIAIALFGLGLLVHLTDPLMYSNPLVAIGLILAIASSFTDAALTATSNTGTPTAVAFAGIVAGVVIAAAARALAKKP